MQGEDKQERAQAPLLTAAEVAELLNISLASVRRLQSDRHIPFFKVGGSVRFSRADIIAYLEQQRVEAITR